MKLLRYIILIKSILLLTAVNNNVLAFSNFSVRQVVQQIDTTKKDTSKTGTRIAPPLNSKTNHSAQDTSSKIEYSAKDSTKYSKDKSIIYLYGKARVIYQSFELDADYIRYDSKNNIIFARGDSTKGKYVGKPIFKMDKEGSSVADSLFYNTKTGKGRVFNTFMEQEGGFFSGGQSKKQPDDEIHVKDIIYSTCDLPHPHFGFHITKGIVTERQIITGPVYLEIEDIPLPIALPFAFFPKPNKKNSGVIIPNVGEDATMGFFLKDAGYYLGISDNWDAKILGTIYTLGSYNSTISANYLKRYKYNGNLNFTYSNQKFGTKGTNDYSINKNFHINWNHSQNPNAHPGSIFSASVDAGTSAFYRATAANGTYDPRAISNNTMSSSISYSKTFGIFNLSTQFGGTQEIQARTISLTLPQVSLSMNSINPFDSKNRVGEQKWYQKFNVGYNMTASNSVSTTEDLLFAKDGFKRFQNGFNHNINASLPFTLAKYFTFSLGSTYNEQWHFQTSNQTVIKGITNGQFNQQRDSTVYDTIPGFKRSGEYSASLNLSTKIYNTLQFKNMGKLQAIRHVMTPSIGVSYKPDFSDPSKGYYKNLSYQDGTPVYDPVYNRIQRYSVFQGTLYTGPSQGQQAMLNFGLDNTVELKVLNPKDTTGTGVKKIPIIQGLSIGGSYNFLAPKFKLSSLGFSGRSQFTDKLGINYNGTLNPYAIEDTMINNMTSKKLVDTYVWQVGKLPRLTSFGFSFDYSFNPEAFKKRTENLDEVHDQTSKIPMTPEQSDQLAAISRDPNAFVDFNVPWNFAFTYSFQYRTDDTGLNGSTTNTLNFNGDFNATPKWKIQFNSGYDFRTHGLALTSISVYRDLHCWDMSVNWVPFGTYRSYSITLKVKASILQDLKLSKQQAYYTRY